MADLDDFFAKKDRKKSKSVKKFTTADELAKKLDDPKQKPDVRPKKERPVQEGEEATRAGEEEEWKEYEEPVKDYTGLKIQVLQGGANAPDTGRDSGGDESAPESGKVKGPWNKPSEPDAPVAPPPSAPSAPPPRASSGAYQPPVARQRTSEPVVRRVQPKNAPDIHNADYFPVLGSNAKRGGGGGGGWSTAGAGGGAALGPRLTAQPLPTGNRFTELQDDS